MSFYPLEVKVVKVKGSKIICATQCVDVAWTLFNEHGQAGWCPLISLLFLCNEKFSVVGVFSPLQ